MSEPELKDYEEEMEEELGLPLASSTPKKSKKKGTKPKQVKKKVTKKVVKKKKSNPKFNLAKFVKKQRPTKKVCLDESRTLLNVLATIPVMNHSLSELYNSACFDKRTTLGSFISKLPQSKKKLLNIIKKKEQTKGVKV